MNTVCIHITLDDTTSDKGLNGYVHL